MPNLSDREKKIIIENAKKLNKNEQIQLLKIIIDNNIKYTENNNGCLINLSKIPDSVILELKNIIDICELRKTEELKRMKFYEEAKLNVEQHYQNKFKKKNLISKSKKKVKKKNLEPDSEAENEPDQNHNQDQHQDQHQDQDQDQDQDQEIEID
jgi:hypothetical protein